MINFIKEITVGNYEQQNKQSICLAYPANNNDAYCITAICGKNNTGKTHLLREIAQTLDQNLHNKVEKQSINVHTLLLNPTELPPNLLHLADLTAYKSRLNEIPIGKYKNDPGGRTPRFREATVSFIGSHLKHRFGAEFDDQRWLTDADYRLRFSQKNLPDRKIFACDNTDLVVRRFEEAVGGKLYFGNKSKAGQSPHLQLALRYDEYRVFYYPNWSDGQKTLLCALLAISFHQPDVLLIDEIENHFHPEYITQLALLIKQKVPQTVIVTHHPHLLFSELVDRVFYVELKSEPLNKMPDEEQLSIGSMPRSPKRQIKELVTDFDIISAAYGLFHNQDRQLMNLAQATINAADAILTRNLAAAFEPDVVQASPGSFVDSQTKQLIEVFQKSTGESKTIKVLDYGAGRGRTLLSVLKYPAVRRGFSFEWDFWEPDSKLRAGLQNLISEVEMPGIRCLPDTDSVTENTYDVAVLANVLHEITPDAFADILSQISKTVKKQTGLMVILELFPLVRPEKYAVPYTREDMESIFTDIGWRIESGALPIKGGVIQAYWVAAYDAGQNLKTDRAQIKTVIEQVWNRIFTRCCARYDGRKQIDSMQD